MPPAPDGAPNNAGTDVAVDELIITNTTTKIATSIRPTDSAPMTIASTVSAPIIQPAAPAGRPMASVTRPLRIVLPSM